MRKSLLLAVVLLMSIRSQAVNLLTESFDGTTFPPSGWASTTGGTAFTLAAWLRVTSGSFPTQSPHSGAGEARFNSFSASNGSAELITPSMSFVGATSGVIVSFWMYRDNGYITTGDKLDVYVNTSATASGGTLLGTVNRSINLSPAVSSNGWYQYSFTTPVSFNTASNYIIFMGTSFYGNDIYLDDISIDNPLCAGTPTTPLITTAAVPAANPICIGSTKSMSAFDPNQPVAGITYQWQSSSSASGPWTNVSSGTGATTVNYTSGALAASTYFRIGVTCTLSSSTSYSAPYYALVGSPQPAIITGSSTYCPGDASTYSVAFVTGSTYTWTLPPGWTGFSTTNSITLTPSAPGTASGTISVIATSSCGTSIPQSRTIVPGSAPGNPGSIAGNNFICPGTSQTYSVIPVGGATGYTWTPSGWSGTSNTNTITATTNSAGGSITVKAINGCGQSSLSTLPVSIIASLSKPGKITGNDTVCSGTLQSYTIAPVPGATSYTWTLPSGWSGSTSGTTIQAFAGTSTGILKVAAEVSCAMSPSSDTTIVVRTTVNPSLTISTPASTTLCQGTPITITATPSHPGSNPVYTWRRNGLPVTAFGTTYTTNTLTKGDSISVTMTSNAVCAANTVAVSNTLYPNITPSVVPGVSINTVPPINLCAGTPVTFNATAAGTGASPTYQWFKNGTAINGATGTSHTDPSLANGDTLTIQMTTTAVCATMPVATSNKVGVRVMDKLTPTVSISVSPSEEAGSGQLLTFTATQSSGGSTPDYQWFKNGVIIPAETGSTYSSDKLQAGDHISVRMLSYETCVTTPLVSSNIIVLKSSLGVGGSGVGASGPELSLYPNPSSGKVHVSVSGWPAAYSGGQVRVDVLSGVGQVVYHMELSPTVSGSERSWKTQVDLGGELASGRYLLRVSTADGSYKATLPFIVNR